MVIKEEVQQCCYMEKSKKINKNNNVNNNKTHNKTHKSEMRVILRSIQAKQKH